MNQDQVARTVGQGRTENPVLSRPWLRSIVPLRLREVRPRKSPRSGTGPWHPAWKLVKSLLSRSKTSSTLPEWLLGHTSRERQAEPGIGGPDPDRPWEKRPAPRAPGAAAGLA